MSKDSAIEWTDHTFNPWWGCTKISPACAHCYAETWSKRLRLPIWGQHAERRFFGDAHWDEPLAWNEKAAREGQRRRVFCASMADVFEDRADLDPWRARQWKLIEATPWLDWLLLTKRPENVGAMVPWGSNWPSNVWLGTTVENADWAAKRIPALLQHSAVIRFLSCEPLLGPIDLSPWMGEIDWVIVGGESGHGARPMRPVWARSLRDQCATAGVSFFFKQWGDIRPATSSDPKARRIVLPDVEGEAEVVMERVGKKNAGRELDGRTWNDVPIAVERRRLAATPSDAAVPQERPRRRVPVGTELPPPHVPDESAAEEQHGHRRRRHEEQQHQQQAGGRHPYGASDDTRRGGRGSDGDVHLAALEPRLQKELSVKKAARSPHGMAKRVPRGAQRRQRAEFVVDKEIAALIPSLSPEELAQLERSILAEGCREPLTVWDDGRRKILLDGHNRCHICRRHGVPYTIKFIKLADRDAAIRWVAEHQLGRRNLTPEAYAFLRGKLYNGMKHQGSRSDVTSGQSAQKSTTAQQLAAQYKVDEKTIRRDGRFAKQLDALADAVGADIKDEVLARGARVSRADVARLLQLDEQTRRRVVAQVRQGARASALLREARRGVDEDVHEGPEQTRQGVDHARSNVAVEDTLEQIALVERALRNTPPGSLSPELIVRTSALLEALDAALATHRRAAVPQQHRPRADITGAVAAVIELQKILIADDALKIPGLGLEELREGEALVEPLADMARAMARLSRPHHRQRRGTPRRPVTFPNFVKELQPILPPNSALAREHGDVLRVFEVFDLANRYLSKIEPAIELACNQHATMRADNPSSAGICDAIERYTEHGQALGAGRDTLFHCLEEHGVSPALFRAAEAAFVEEVREGTRAAFASLGEKLKHSPSPAQNAPTASSSLQLPITAPLNKSAFEEMRGIVRDCLVVMDEGCERLAEMYRGQPVPRDVDRIWSGANNLAQQCRPLLDGTFTHAEHLRAWGVASPNHSAGRAPEVITQARTTALPSTTVAPAPSPTSPVSKKPTPQQWDEYSQFSQGYSRAMVPPEGVLAEIEKKDWPDVLKERARWWIFSSWQMATAPSRPPARAGG
ncbi:DUF5131 family protein [Sorangium sp. So ce362]|uniref:DUF5131 family protein n=1 Tax=Sorangium sp. So ce362 TaxID=3133303 RepID=UPI003F5EEC30